MEHFSIKNKPSSSKEHISEASEESGWTAYLEDLSESPPASVCSLGSVSGSSLVSDAASHALQKLPKRAGAQGRCKKLSFKKGKASVFLDDDPLEDTASSPVNTPRVSHLNGLEMRSRENDELNKAVVQVRHDESQHESRNDKINGVSFVERTNECMELRRRGLCLVPLSILLDYI